MTATPEQLKGITRELDRSRGLPAYEAIDAAWLALLKSANLMAGTDEHERITSLLEQLPEDRIHLMLLCASVDSLLDLQPPLESVLSEPHEEIDAARTARQLAVVRAKRDTEPIAALQKLVSVLKRVRNRRMHGFKTPDGPRDQEILMPSADILQQLAAIVLDTFRPNV